MRWGWTHRYAVPMFVASLVAVVLTGSGLVWVLAAGQDGGGPNGGDIDSCVLGRWQMVSYTENLEALGLTLPLELVGQGAVYEFRADGTGTADYGDGTRFQSESLGQPVLATVTGTISFRYQAADGTFQVTNSQSDATFEADTLPGIPSAYQLSTEPESYQCAGNALSFSVPAKNYLAEYQRIT